MEAQNLVYLLTELENWSKDERVDLGRDTEQEFDDYNTSDLVIVGEDEDEEEHHVSCEDHLWHWDLCSSLLPLAS